MINTKIDCNIKTNIECCYLLVNLVACCSLIIQVDVCNDFLFRGCAIRYGVSEDAILADR